MSGELSESTSNAQKSITVARAESKDKHRGRGCLSPYKGGRCRIFNERIYSATTLTVFAERINGDPTQETAGAARPKKQSRGNPVNAPEAPLLRSMHQESRLFTGYRPSVWQISFSIQSKTGEEVMHSGTEKDVAKIESYSAWNELREQRFPDRALHFTSLGKHG